MKRLKCMYGSIIFLACTVRRLKVMFTYNYSRNNFETLSEDSPSTKMSAQAFSFLTAGARIPTVFFFGVGQQMKQTVDQLYALPPGLVKHIVRSALP